MRVTVLFSGGKDSSYALYNAMPDHEIVCLLTVKAGSKDSYMYHLPNIHLTVESSEALGLPLVVVESPGKKEEEVLDLEEALKGLKEEKKIEGVVAGAIASNYQRERIQGVCDRLGLELIAPLWGREEESLLREMLAEGFKIIVVGVYAQGLGQEWLGRVIDENAIKELVKLREKYDIRVSGEGGEFETLVLDSPMHEKSIKIVEAEKKFKGLAGELNIKKVVLEEKN